MRRSYKGIVINTSKNTHEKVFRLLNQDINNIIVDIPSGHGAFVQKLKDVGFKKIIAIDIENILAIDHNDFIKGDMSNTLPLSNNSCDSIVCIDGIEHIRNPFEFIAEANRILKEEGEMIISTPNISSIRSRWKWLLTGHHHKCNSPLDENNPNPLHHINMVSFPELRYMLHTNGFLITTVSTNRIKPINWIYLVFLPLVFISTYWVYSKTGKKQSTSVINKSVFKSMFTKHILFGETLIVKAKKYHR